MPRIDERYNYIKCSCCGDVIAITMDEKPKLPYILCGQCVYYIELIGAAIGENIHFGPLETKHALLQSRYVIFPFEKKNIERALADIRINWQIFGQKADESEGEKVD